MQISNCWLKQHLPLNVPRTYYLVGTWSRVTAAILVETKDYNQKQEEASPPS